MTGANLFVPPRLILLERRRRAVGIGPRQGVFISHSRADKDKAREVADVLQEVCIDYYFDENDEALQAADEQSNHLKVVRCIDAGIRSCTHLLGIITENTKDSWWVPYEIGHARGKGRKCAHLIDREVDSLPSYIRAATILPDRSALRGWLPREINQPVDESGLNEILFEARTLAAITAARQPAFVPPTRSMNRISFY